MLDRVEYAALGFETFHDDFLRKLVVRERVELAVGVHQCSEHLEPAAVGGRVFEEVRTGWRWGPVWSTAWFRLRGAVPHSMRNDRVVLRFSSGTEALLWLDGVPHQGFDPYHHHARLDLTGIEATSLLVEAACNRPLGATMFWWEHSEEHGRWGEESPGRLEQAALELHDEGARDFCRDWMFAVKLMRTSDESESLANELERGLRDLKSGILAEGPEARLDRWLPGLRSLLERGPKRSTRCVVVGHAHIDTAWLWPLSETRRKCMRTFATQLRNLEEQEEFRFLCSQPQQYRFVEEGSPELFRQIARRVEEGRWEPFGAMWVEPDANIPSGESLIRQIQHGTRYFRDRFGDRAKDDALYLPDTFGFPASLPQICRGCGLDTFITNKIAWNETNRFPHVTFEWKGIDGTCLLTHFTPGHNYNSSIDPQDFIDAEKRMLASDGAGCRTWLQPYGWGDGGGGPDRTQISNARNAAVAAGLPEVEHGSAREFCRRLHEEFRAHPGGPQWDGELYLELHRGTYTSQARLKASNRRAECELREIEALGFLNRVAGAALAGTARLDDAWKTVLLNQFHDILPGSSINAVNREAHRQLDELHGSCHELIEEALREAMARADTRTLERPVLVWNPASCGSDRVVDTESGPVLARDLPGVGIRMIDLARPDRPEHPVRAEGTTLENGLCRFTVDATGRIGSLAGPGGELPIEEPLNTLVLHADRPRRWQAWDLDRDYVDHRSVQDGEAERVELVERSELRGVIECVRSLGSDSRITQRYVLEAESPVVRIETHLDWREDDTMLRAEFAPTIRARSATHGIQFGSLQRPTHANTSWDRAAFEVPGHLWMDLSQPGRGLAILDDGSRIGRSCHGNRMGLSLARSSGFPDPEADRGVHRFSYGLMPHEGDWRTAGVREEAERLLRPARTMTANAGTPGEAGIRWSCLEGLGSAAGIELSALKEAEDGSGWIVRVVEMQGGSRSVGFTLPPDLREVEVVDLLERPLPREGLVLEEGRCTLRLEPFQIRTLRIR